MHEKDVVNVPVIVVSGIVAAILLYATIILLQVLFINMRAGEADRKVTSARSSPLVDARSQQEAKLNSYNWIDRDKGITSIPIERAMEMVVEELAHSVEPPAGQLPDKAEPPVSSDSTVVDQAEIQPH